MFGKDKPIREFTRQLVMLLESDVPLHTAIELIGYQQTSKRRARAMQEIVRALGRGEPLSQALKYWGRGFSPGYILTIEWAEKKGRMKDMLIALRLLAGDDTPVRPL